MKHMILAIALILLPLGVMGQSHTVTVNWNASPDAGNNPSLSYNVYRATSACTGSPTFSKINSTAAGVLTFTDNTVNVGQTYCYQVTSVLNGVEGSPSNSAPAVILPSPPSNVTTTQ